jgi:hypothetical protein
VRRPKQLRTAALRGDALLGDGRRANVGPEHELEFARIWKDTPRIVFSKTLEKVEGNARLVRDNVAEEVARLKEEPELTWPSAAPAWPRPS